MTAPAAEYVTVLLPAAVYQRLLAQANRRGLDLATLGGALLQAGMKARRG